MLGSVWHRLRSWLRLPTIMSRPVRTSLEALMTTLTDLPNSIGPRCSRASSSLGRQRRSSYSLDPAESPLLARSRLHIAGRRVTRPSEVSEFHLKALRAESSRRGTRLREFIQQPTPDVHVCKYSFLCGGPVDMAASSGECCCKQKPADGIGEGTRGDQR